MTVTIRTAIAADETRWRELWDAYTRFYEREPSEGITVHTWSRIIDPASPVCSIVAETNVCGVIGMANYVVQESTSKLTPICCLQDLFVEPERRATGAGKKLIDWLVEEMKSKGWSRLYWHTRENNYRARSLYDKYTLQDGFVRYRIENVI